MMTDRNSMIKLIVERIEKDIKAVSLKVTLKDLIGYGDIALEHDFKTITGVTVRQYALNRKLYLCGLEIDNGADSSLTELSMDYSFESYDSFIKHFTRFHGFPPSKTRDPNNHLKSFFMYGYPEEDEQISNHRLVYMDDLYLNCRERYISYEHTAEEIYGFWKDCSSSSGSSPSGHAVCKVSDEDDDGFYYYISDIHVEMENMGSICLHIPKTLWDVYTVKGPYPASVKSFLEYIFTKNETGKEYRIALPYLLEKHSGGDMSSIEYECDVWIAVEHMLQDPSVYLR